MTESVRSLVEEFPKDPFHASRLLRERRDADAAAFEIDALRSLAEIDDSPGARYVATLLHEDGFLVQRIADPHFLDLPQAVRLMLALRRTDSQADVRLARMLMPGSKSPLPQGHVERALEILEALCDGPRLIPVLLQLYRSLEDDSPAKHRFLTAIARHHRNREWIEERLREADPLIRAGVVEAYMGETSSEALGIFRYCAQDPHPRVAGTAAVALHRAGLVESLPLIGVRLGNSNVPEVRAWAAQAMGRTQDPRFLRDLSRLVKDGEPQVRKQAFQALKSIKAARADAGPRPGCSLRFIKLHRAATQGVLHVLFELTGLEDRAAIRGIHPLETVVTENGLPVYEYTLQERVKYPTPGVYDLHFQTRGPAANGMLAVEVAIHSPKCEGSHTSYWFGE